MAVDRAGPAARALLSAYWVCGDPDELAATVRAAGLEVVESRTHLGAASFPSPEALAETEVRGSPLVDRISDEVFAWIREGAKEVLRPFTGPAGAVEAPLRGLLLAARVPGG